MTKFFTPSLPLSINLDTGSSEPDVFTLVENLYNTNAGIAVDSARLTSASDSPAQIEKSARALWLRQSMRPLSLVCVNTQERHDSVLFTHSKMDRAKAPKMLTIRAEAKLAPRSDNATLKEVLHFLNNHRVQNVNIKSYAMDAQNQRKLLDSLIKGDTTSLPCDIRHMGQFIGAAIPRHFLPWLVALTEFYAETGLIQQPDNAYFAESLANSKLGLAFLSDSKLGAKGMDAVVTRQLVEHYIHTVMKRNLTQADVRLQPGQDDQIGYSGLFIFGQSPTMQTCDITGVILTRYELAQFITLHEVFWSNGLTKEDIESIPSDPQGWKEYLGQLSQVTTTPLKEPEGVIVEVVEAEETPVQEPEDGADLIPIVPEKEREAFEVGYRQWLRYDVRAFLFKTEVYPTQTGVEPYTARMIHDKAADQVVYVFETALQIFMDEHGQFLRKVVGFLENPNGLQRVSYQYLVGGLMQGQHPDEPLYRVRHNMDNLGYYMSMPYYKNLLALMSWVSDTFGVPPHVEKLLRVSGLVSDDAKEMRHRMFKDIRQQNVNEQMTAGVCGIAVASHAGARIALTGVIIPARKMRLLKDALLSRIPDFFDRVRAEDIPEGPGTAWMDYFDRVLGDEPVATPVVEAAPEMVTPAEDAFYEAGPAEDVLADEPVADELPVEAVPVQDIELLEPEVLEVETPVERKVRQRRERVAKLKPEAILAGMDADTLWDEVLTNPMGYFACEVEGPARMTPELRALVREGKAETAVAKEGTTKRFKRTVELETAITQSKLAVMEWQHFESTVDRRRYPAKHWLENLLGREINFNKANVVDITPDRIGELPGLVAGLHRKSPDRLCVVRVVMRHKVIVRHTSAERKVLRDARKAEEKRTGKKIKLPEVRIKTRQVSATRLHRQSFRFAEFPMLAVFPAGWMAPVAEPWMPGLFGTPYDPTLMDFCDTLSPEWWADLAKVIPAKDETRPMLDVRALRP